MDLFSGLLQGFQVALTAGNLLMCVVGVVLGTVIGVLPGLGPPATIAMLLALWIASMGTDLFTATSRFTFGRIELLGGIDFVIVAIGVFAIGEVLGNMEPAKPAEMLPVPKGLRNLLPTREDMRRCR